MRENVIGHFTTIQLTKIVIFCWWQVVPPLGWTFEKDGVVVNIDGENDVCSQNKECANYQIKSTGPIGFQVTFLQVLCRFHEVERGHWAVYDNVFFFAGLSILGTFIEF